MKKKIITLFMTAIMVSGLVAGCGTTKLDNSTSKAVTETETIIEMPVETEAPTEVVEETETSTEYTTEMETSTELVEEPNETQVPGYTYTDLTATKYAQSAVNVRDLPEAEGKQLGSLSQNQEVTITGQCNETSWYRIEYNGSVGYVSNNYLGDTTVEVQEPTPAADTTSASTAETPAPAAEAYPSVCSAGHETKIIYNVTVGTEEVTGVPCVYYDYYSNPSLVAPSNLTWGECAAAEQQDDALNGPGKTIMSVTTISQETLPCGCTFVHAKYKN